MLVKSKPSNPPISLSISSAVFLCFFFPQFSLFLPPPFFFSLLCEIERDASEWPLVVGISSFPLDAIH